jgi:hypothetical protein
MAVETDTLTRRPKNRIWNHFYGPQTRNHLDGFMRAVPGSSVEPEPHMCTPLERCCMGPNGQATGKCAMLAGSNRYGSAAETLGRRRGAEPLDYKIDDCEKSTNSSCPHYKLQIKLQVIFYILHLHYKLQILKMFHNSSNFLQIIRSTIVRSRQIHHVL